MLARCQISSLFFSIFARQPSHITCNSVICEMPSIFNFQRPIFSPRREKEIGDDEESSKSLLVNSITSSKDYQKHARTFNIHVAFSLLHTLIAALWISTFWTLNISSPPRSSASNGEGLRKYEFCKVSQRLRIRTIED